MNYLGHFLFGIVVGAMALTSLRNIIYRNCNISGHDFKQNGKVDICHKCQLIRTRIEK